MAKKKTTPQAQPNSLETMFPPMGAEPEQQKPSLEDRFKELSDTVGSLSKDLKESRTREERLQGLVTSLAGARQQPQQQQQPPAVTGIDFSKLPDPTKDPDGYRNGLQQQINASVQASVEAQVAPQRQAQQQAQRVEQLWKDFTDKYEDLAEFKDIAEVAAAKIVRDGVANGVSPEATIFTDRDGFMERVANNMRDRLKAIRGSGEDEEEDGEDARPEPQRTIGIPGSTTGTGTGKGAATDPAQSTMLSELKEQQKGIYY